MTPLAPHVEQCAATNAIWGTDGPTFDVSNAGSLFSAIIRPASRHQAAVEVLKSIAAQALASLPAFNEADYGDKPAELQANRPPLTQDQIDGVVTQFANRMASMMAVDDLIGVIGRQLLSSGVADNTIILFTSDNGWFHGQHRLSNKVLAYEESVRVPLFVTLPSVTSGEISFKTIINTDWAPMLAALGGVQPSTPLDGRSFVPFLQEPRSQMPWRKRFLVEHYVPVWDDEIGRVSTYHSFRAVRTTDEDTAMPYRMLTDYFSGLQYQTGIRDQATVRWYRFPTTPPTGPLVLLGTRVDEELYRMTTDPHQLTNLLGMGTLRPWGTGSSGTRSEPTGRSFMTCSGATCHALETQ